MAFCGKCGNQVEDGVKFCPGCGAAMAEQAAEAPKAEAPKADPNDLGAKLQNIGNTADVTADFDEKDIADNKVMAVLSYFGPLVLVPIFAAPNSKYARFHANQGLLLMLGEIAYGVVQAILTALLRAIFQPYYTFWTYTRGPVYNILTLILSAVWTLFTVLAIIGIVNAAQNKAKELPIIGKFKILK